MIEDMETLRIVKWIGRVYFAWHSRSRFERDNTPIGRYLC